MNGEMCLKLEAVGALVRERMPEWRGYRGQGKRPAFTENVVRLAVFLAKYHHRRARGVFAVARMAIEKLVGLGDHAIRSALKCLVEIGLVEPASELERRGKRLGMNPGARSVWYQARIYRFSSFVMEILAPDEPKPRLKQTRQDEPSRVQSKTPRKIMISLREILAPFSAVRRDPLAIEQAEAPLNERLMAEARADQRAAALAKLDAMRAALPVPVIAPPPPIGPLRWVSPLTGKARR